jgi:hypothetical protein
MGGTIFAECWLQFTEDFNCGSRSYAIVLGDCDRGLISRFGVGVFYSKGIDFCIKVALLLRLLGFLV